jgi:hydrogenase maturation factor
MNRETHELILIDKLNEPIGSFCVPDAQGRCLTCADEALPARVIELDPALALAQVEINNTITEVDISLVDEVAVGHLLLVHGGVAIANLGQENDATS